MQLIYHEPIFVPETESTNNYLAELCDCKQLAEMTCVYTSFQSAGRGQRGNSWESEPGKNLLFSFALYPQFLKANRQFLISQITALGIMSALSLHTEDISIKWPNDIYWRDKKISGTLIENEINGSRIARSIVGSGININQTEFKSDAPNPVSLTQITGLHYDPRDILAEVMDEISQLYIDLKNGDKKTIRTSYLNHLYRKDGFHPFKDKNGEFIARIDDIDHTGKLILEDQKGKIREYMFKEVEYIL